MPDLPARRIPRAALERVLLRAAELHAAAGDVPEAMTEEELLSLANEVGISPLAVRQALAEERMRLALPEERGMMAAAVGPSFFSASRMVPGQAKEILDRIDRAFQVDENLAERRRFPDRVVWGERGGFAGAVRELVRLDGRGFPLTRTDEVSATVIQVEPARVHVRLETSMVRDRSAAVRNALISAFVGAAAASVLLILGTFPILAAAAGTAIVVGGSLFARRSYRRHAAATQLAIEQALDRLEFGEPRKRGLLDQILIAGR